MAVSADQDRRPWPVMAEIGQETGQDHRVLHASGTHPRPEAGRHQGVRGAFENEQREVARALVVLVMQANSCWP